MTVEHYLLVSPAYGLDERAAVTAVLDRFVADGWEVVNMAVSGSATYSFLLRRERPD